MPKKKSENLVRASVLIDKKHRKFVRKQRAAEDFNLSRFLRQKLDEYMELVCTHKKL